MSGTCRAGQSRVLVTRETRRARLTEAPDDGDRVGFGRAHGNTRENESGSVWHGDKASVGNRTRLDDGAGGSIHKLDLFPRAFSRPTELLGLPGGRMFAARDAHHAKPGEERPQ